MATQIQTLQRTVIQPSRRHDYLYDPLYTLAGQHDHARATMQAAMDASKLKRVPVYDSMFSELRHHPRFEIRLDTVDPVPKFISRQWRGNQSENRNAVLKLRAQPGGSAMFANVQLQEDPQVTGANRYKYFRRPLIPFNEPLGPEVVLATSRQDPLMSGLSYGREQQRSITPFTKVAQTQTDYRDSDVQTDPYSPEYVVQPGTQPELVSLALLSYGCGLPAGLAEVEMIERARAKRAWEATLPDLHDVEQMDKRRRMMEQQELAEWALREQEIERIQEERLDVLLKLLKKREEQHEELNTTHLDRLWSSKQVDMQAKIDRIRQEHVRAMRKIIEKKRKVEGKLDRKTLIELYSDVGSQAYAPLTRIGVFRDRNSEQNSVRSKYLSTLNGLLELESSLPDFVLKPVVRAPQRLTTTHAGFLKRKYREEKKLADIYQTIQDEKIRQNASPKPLRFLQCVEKPAPRPPTPSVDVPSAEEEEKELAVIYLQQLIRGRSLQNMMYEGREQRAELIGELRSTHALQVAEQQLLHDERQATLLLQRQQQLFEHKENVVEEKLSEMEGESLGDMLDFLSKELIRLQEERRIHAFSILAERQRRIREAEESGQRQVEERRRREHDEIFKQVMKVHQNTVDTYLEDVIMAAVDRTASDQARSEIQLLAEQINDAAYAAEQNRSKLQSEEIVAELVHDFLLPEIQKQTVRDKVQQQQRKYLLAAHREIFESASSLDLEQLQGQQFQSGGAALSLEPTAPELSRQPSADIGSRAGRVASAGSAASRPQSSSQHGGRNDASTDVSLTGSQIRRMFEEDMASFEQTAEPDVTSEIGSATVTPQPDESGAGRVGSAFSDVVKSASPASKRGESRRSNMSASRSGERERPDSARSGSSISSAKSSRGNQSRTGTPKAGGAVNDDERPSSTLSNESRTSGQRRVGSSHSSTA